MISYLRGLAYRVAMRFAHRFHWHYMPPIYPERDTVLWCQWCGVRVVLARFADDAGSKGLASLSSKIARSQP